MSYSTLLERQHQSLEVDSEARRYSFASQPAIRSGPSASKTFPAREDDDGSINAMGMAGLSPETIFANRGEFYGASSAASFLSDIQSRLNARSWSSKPRSTRVAIDSPQQTYAQESRMQMDDYHLPPRHLAVTYPLCVLDQDIAGLQ